MWVTAAKGGGFETDISEGKTPYSPTFVGLW
jgi:hypothetical protein